MDKINKQNNQVLSSKTPIILSQHTNPARKKISSIIGHSDVKQTTQLRISDIVQQRNFKTERPGDQNYCRQTDTVLPIRRILFLDDDVDRSLQDKQVGDDNNHSTIVSPTGTNKKTSVENSVAKLKGRLTEQHEGVQVDRSNISCSEILPQTYDLSKSSKLKCSNVSRKNQIEAQNIKLRQEIKMYQETNKVLESKIQKSEANTKEISEEIKKLMVKYNEDLSKHNENLMKQMRECYDRDIALKTLPDDSDRLSVSSRKYSVCSRGDRLESQKRKMSGIKEKLDKIDFKQAQRIVAVKKVLKF